MKPGSTGLPGLLENFTESKAMLKYIKHHMDTILGIEAYPVASLLIFFVFFTIVTILVFTMTRQRVQTLSNLPFEDGLSKENIPSTH
jgi:hypothetical protein